MTLPDRSLHELLRRDAEAGWRAFVDQYTPLLLGLIRRAGVSDRDEVMDVYLLVCSRLSDHRYARLKAQDPNRGTLAGYLVVACRHAVVDWVRSKKGRRRLFKSVDALPPPDQRVFELFYWDRRSPSEIVEILRAEEGAPVELAEVLDRLARVDVCLTERQRAELLAMCARTIAPASIEDGAAEDVPAGVLSDPARSARISQLKDKLEQALRALPALDAAIVRLKFIEGLSATDVAAALGLDGLSPARLAALLATLRAALAAIGVRTADVVALEEHL